MVRHHYHHLLTLPLTEHEITLELRGLISHSTFNKRMQRTNCSFGKMLQNTFDNAD